MDIDVSKIDEGLRSIIMKLNNNGLITISSCDGMVAHHAEQDAEDERFSAYIAFDKCHRIIDLMATFLLDRDEFEIGIYKGNGMTYVVRFSNKYGERLDYVQNIISSFIEGRIAIGSSEKKRLLEAEQVLGEAENSDLNFDINFNTKYQPITDKGGRINKLTIYSKTGTIFQGDDEYASIREIGPLMMQISKDFNFPRKEAHYAESFEDDEFILNINSTKFEIYFLDEHIHQILDIIRQSRSMETSLPIKLEQRIPYDGNVPDVEALMNPQPDFKELEGTDAIKGWDEPLI